jgi:serine/threonine-protein kinase HipA
MRELDVTVAGVRVGTLAYEDYTFSFRYERPRELDRERHLVSLTMPVRARSYETQILPPPFQSVLPEGELLIRLRARFGKVIDVDDDFNLLRLVGHNTIGRVTFGSEAPLPEPASAPSAVAPPAYDLTTVLRHPDGAELLDELIDTYGVRSGVGGVHPKALIDGGGRRLTVVGDHLILKAAGRDFPHLPVNEYFCLLASEAAGVPTVRAHLSDAADLLAIERFDRSGSGEPLAFEEICALRQLARHGKYNGSYDDVAEVIRQIRSRPSTAWSSWPWRRGTVTRT